MYSSYQIILAIGMVITGSINTLSVKWADKLQSIGSDGKLHPFNHPFVQSLTMFLGEFLCLLFFKLAYRYHLRREFPIEDSPLVKGNQQFSPFLFFIPAMLDMVATTLMYIGLTMTYASSFQMLRGAVIIFTAVFSKIFVHRQVSARHWLGIFTIIVGLATVGVSDLLSSGIGTKSADIIILGDSLILIAQIITAAQMVYEEKYVVTNDIPPLQAVGWEGVFGFLMMGSLLVPFYYIKVGSPLGDGNSRGVIEDFPEAITQIMNNKLILIALIGNIISIAYFNFSGISVAKEISATTRMVLDSVRTFFIWTFSLAIGWQGFHPLQPVGFLLLLIGMCIYNNLLRAVPRRLRTVVHYPTDEPIIGGEP
ncbi:Chloroquine-resistance transporter-like,Nucleotide-sugar transporter-related [Cinara cedri]|uniref:Chloroquine-resistance transporter-like,Nucleotide-sugar transporter-related n=1 Tax=Cinara cedri TaxID=506608 RepID=A0A5E4MAW9_9HEMI|nr:Chloroquine-resistance transporter-like,Nucleotide-sugar transporter-related [Cinara cedri]